MSLLLSEGHADARHYPVGMVWVESEIAVTRVNDVIATEALLIQLAISSALSKEGGAAFSKAIGDLTDRD